MSFAELFAGRTDAYGTGRGEVIRARVTPALYADHLAGKGHGLGIFPLGDEGTVNFAAIDLDQPDFTAAAAMADMLPGTTWIERSRSGNAHVWAFFLEPIEAWVARGLMREATAAIGLPKVEVFPKQDRLLEGMVGNYINLPYHGDDRPILQDGVALTLQTFTACAMKTRNEPAAWQRRAEFMGIEPPEMREQTSEFGAAATLHCCAEHIIANRFDNPVREGHRATVFFALAKQLLNYEGFDEDEAWQWLSEVNEASPESISESELRRIFTNVLRGQFTSTGCDDPLFAPYAHPDCPIARTS